MRKLRKALTKVTIVVAMAATAGAILSWSFAGPPQGHLTGNRETGANEGFEVESPSRPGSLAERFHESFGEIHDAIAAKLHGSHGEKAAASEQSEVHCCQLRAPHCW